MTIYNIHFIIIARLTAVLLLIGYVSSIKSNDDLNTASSCLTSLSDIDVLCPQSSQKIKVRSVSYAFTPDCNNPASDNDCVQASAFLSKRAQGDCDGRTRCKVKVQSVFETQKELEALGPDREQIQQTMNGCGVSGRLQTEVSMNIVQVKFECQEFAFCNSISDSIADLAIATTGFPEKSVTNPTCHCTFESEDKDVYALVGYANCNGTVIFITEETNSDEEVNKLEYKCIDKLQSDVFFIGTGISQPWKLKLTVDVERSDEESAYKISWFNAVPRTGQRKRGANVKVDCSAGSFWVKYSVKLILMIALPIVAFVLIAAIIIYCIWKTRRRQAKEWRASHIRLQRPAKSQKRTDRVDRGEVEYISPAEVAPIQLTKPSRSSSVASFNRKDERVDPEGNVDEIGDFARELKFKNEERRRKELEKRYQYQGGYPPSYTSYTPSPSHTMLPPTPTPSQANIQPNRRAQSYGNLRSERRQASANPRDVTPEPKPLAHSKSASQSRTSVRSLKRRAPQPPGPKAEPAPVHQSTRTNPMYTSSNPNLNRTKSGRGRPPTHSQPHHRRHSPPSHSEPYADSPDSDPDTTSDTEEMAILRPTTRPPKPPVAPKPQVHQKYAKSRYPPTSNSRGVTPSDIKDLRQEMEDDSD